MSFTPRNYTCLVFIVASLVLALPNCGLEEDKPKADGSNKVEADMYYNNESKWRFSGTNPHVDFSLQANGMDTLFIDVDHDRGSWLYFEIIDADLSYIENDSFQFGSQKNARSVWVSNFHNAITTEIFYPKDVGENRGWLYITKIDASRGIVEARFEGELFVGGTLSFEMV